jgi:hypothetical protein
VFIDRYVGDGWTSQCKKGRNKTCPICLENIDYKSQNVICCISGCRNAVHAMCWNRYYVASNRYAITRVACVVCRGDFMPMFMD